VRNISALGYRIQNMERGYTLYIEYIWNTYKNIWNAYVSIQKMDTNILQKTKVNKDNRVTTEMTMISQWAISMTS